MTERKISLQDGTVVRHKTKGYEGLIEGITEIKTCFTKGGAAIVAAGGKEAFQYRVVVSGQSMRYIAPADDLEIVEAAAEMTCGGCGYHFQSKPGVVDKAGGHCQCGGWICPACLACQPTTLNASGQPTCLKQRKRLVRKLATGKKLASPFGR
jgi:hypothetical protein